MSDTEYRFMVHLGSLPPGKMRENWIGSPARGGGGGYIVEYPDLPGCMSDGETIEEAIANAEDAKAAMKEAGRPVAPPSVGHAEGYSGTSQLRAPKSSHRRLAERRREGVSLNTLAVTLLAEGLGVRSVHGE
jgi:antitoxin HicB